MHATSIQFCINCVTVKYSSSERPMSLQTYIVMIDIALVHWLACRTKSKIGNSSWIAMQTYDCVIHFYFFLLYFFHCIQILFHHEQILFHHEQTLFRLYTKKINNKLWTNFWIFPLFRSFSDFSLKKPLFRFWVFQIIWKLPENDLRFSDAFHLLAVWFFIFN